MLMAINKSNDVVLPCSKILSSKEFETCLNRLRKLSAKKVETVCLFDCLFNNVRPSVYLRSDMPKGALIMTYIRPLFRGTYPALSIWHSVTEKVCSLWGIEPGTLRTTKADTEQLQK